VTLIRKLLCRGPNVSISFASPRSESIISSTSFQALRSEIRGDPLRARLPNFFLPDGNSSLSRSMAKRQARRPGAMGQLTATAHSHSPTSRVRRWTMAFHRPANANGSTLDFGHFLSASDRPRIERDGDLGHSSITYVLESDHRATIVANELFHESSVVDRFPQLTESYHHAFIVTAAHRWQQSDFCPRGTTLLHTRHWRSRRVRAREGVVPRGRNRFAATV